MGERRIHCSRNACQVKRSVDEIAALYQVHRVTMSRLLTEAREALGRRTKRRLRDLLGANERDLAPLDPLLDSQLELSLERLLAENRGD